MFSKKSEPEPKESNSFFSKFSSSEEPEMGTDRKSTKKSTKKSTRGNENARRGNENQRKVSPRNKNTSGSRLPQRHSARSVVSADEKKAMIRDLSTGLADTATDWTYYFHVTSELNAGKYGGLPLYYSYLLLGFSIFGTIMFLLFLLNTFLKVRGKNQLMCGLGKIMWIGALFEDVPQFVLTYLTDIHLTGEQISPEAMLNFTTSVFSLIIRATETYPSIPTENSSGSVYYNMA